MSEKRVHKFSECGHEAVTAFPAKIVERHHGFCFACIGETPAWAERGTCGGNEAKYRRWLRNRIKTLRITIGASGR